MFRFASLLLLSILVGTAPAMAQVTFYSSDFEADNGGWAGTGDWEWGVVPPTPDLTGCFKGSPVFPAGANSGTNAWATDLDGCHSPSTTSRLTRTFDFSGLAGTIELCWSQFINTGGNTFDQARVFANTTELRLDDGSSAGAYETVCVNLDAFAGNPSVEIAYQLVTTATVERAGWYIDDVIITASVIPVELTRFEGRADGRDAVLSWATASETNNAGFEVQVRAPGAEGYAVLGFVEGHGTTTEAQAYSFRAEGLAPGTYAFRLRQVDFDGQYAYHGDVEVDVETPGTHLLTAAYPNPFNPQATFTLSVAQRQQVTVELFNALGQRVGALFNGTLDANATRSLTIDGAGLPSGAYVVRVTGETFADALRVALVK